MASTWQGKSKGGKAGYQIFVWLIRNTGLAPTYLVLRCVAFYYFLFSPASSKPILYLYRSRLGMGRFESLRALYRNYYCLGQTLIDKVAAMAGYASRFKSRSQGLENLETIARGGKGGLLLSAHMGNWEIAGHFLKKLDKRINLVMFDGERQEIKNYLGNITGEKSFNIITIQPDGSHVFKIANVLANNELVCMHADRFVPGNKTLNVSFLGRDAKFPEGPFVLGAKLGVPVSFVFAFKDGNFGYQFSASPPISFPNGGREAPLALLQQFAAILEGHVRERPEQWFNYYDFWQ